MTVYILGFGWLALMAYAFWWTSLDDRPQERAKHLWLVIGDSVTGSGHIRHQLPCQDAHAFKALGQDLGIAVVADGAGSARHSEQGSALACELAVQKFGDWARRVIPAQGLPDPRSWQAVSYRLLADIRSEVTHYAGLHKLKPSDLACTIMVMVYTSGGICVTHIGDGRGAYRSAAGTWLAAFSPWKGEEANQTLFITSAFWHRNLADYIESCVIAEPVTGFALMSDGCEKHAFECSQLDPASGNWHDPNRPFAGFFEPLEKVLRHLYAQQTPAAEIEAKWSAFLRAGSPGLKAETDDKTLVVGLLQAR